MVPNFTILIILTVLFILLSPGILVTLPPPTRDVCENTQHVYDCQQSTTYSAQCNQCTSVWNSSFTQRWAIALHTLVQILLAQILLILLPWTLGAGVSMTYQGSTQQLLALAGLLFFVLSPGMIVTLPPNSDQQCKNNLGIQDDPISDLDNCTGVWASSFTSGAAVLFHALVFLLLILWLSFLFF